MKIDVTSERDGKVDVGERRAIAKAGVPLRSALIACTVFYIVAGVLNGRALHERASKRPYGLFRDIWMAATAPLSWISSVTKLDQFRAWIEEQVGDSP